MIEIHAVPSRGLAQKTRLRLPARAVIIHRMRTHQHVMQSQPADQHRVHEIQFASRWRACGYARLIGRGKDKETGVA
jgi:hypothetical protein